MTAAGMVGAPGILAALFEVRTGQLVASYRTWRIDTALRPLLRRHGLATLEQLVTLLLSGIEPRIGDEIVDALVNQETSFFRDGVVFDAAVAAVELAETEGRRPRIWSAGCSTGQEPLSLAMLFAERRVETGLALPEIVASDVAAGALARARAGRFTQFEVQRGLAIGRLVRWFTSNGSEWTAASELLAAIGWRRLNLVADPFPSGLFDVVLCRNVLLYFGPEVRQAVLARLAQALRPGGLLALGAGETLIGHDLFAPSRRFRGCYEPLVEMNRAVA